MPDEAAHLADQPAGATASSAYRTGRDFERAIRRAAARLRRRGAFPHEGAWLVVCAVIVAALALNKVAADLAPWRPGDVLGWREVVPAGVLVALWLIWYMFRAHLLGAEIVGRRCCFHCGRSLLDVTPDEAGDGACPDCGSLFNLGMYRPPMASVDALHEARERMLRRCPPATIPHVPIGPRLYSVESKPGAARPVMGEREFERCVRRAAWDIVLRERAVIGSFMLVWALFIAMMALGAAYGEDGFMWSGGALLIVLAAVYVYVTSRQMAASNRVVATLLRRGMRVQESDHGGKFGVDRHAASQSLLAVWNPSLAMPPHPPPPDAGAGGLCAGSILAARLKYVLRAVRRRLRRM